MNASHGPRNGSAVTYIRTAPSDRSAAVQEARCQDLAERCHLQVRRVYRDIGISGSRLDRPALRQMLAYVAKHSVSHVVVADPVRLGRNAAIRARVRRRIEGAGAVVIDSTPTPAQYLAAQIGMLVHHHDAQRQRHWRHAVSQGGTHKGARR